MQSDQLAQLLFDQSPLLARHQTERALRLRVSRAWEELARQQQEGTISTDTLRTKLEELDVFVEGKLSGENVLALAREAECMYPEFIAVMPRALASRFEQLRIARLWASLLNPEALKRLSIAVAQDRTATGNAA
jgi:hypothetical protein